MFHLAEAIGPMMCPSFPAASACPLCLFPQYFRGVVGEMAEAFDIGKHGAAAFLIAPNFLAPIIDLVSVSEWAKELLSMDVFLDQHNVSTIEADRDKHTKVFAGSGACQTCKSKLAQEGISIRTIIKKDIELFLT
eukprot:4767091-Pyramimonas_sp.AAC.1